MFAWQYVQDPLVYLSTWLIVAAKTPFWSVTSQDREQLHAKERESTRKRYTKFSLEVLNSVACMKFSVIALALGCTQTNQALERSPLFQRVKNAFQWLLAACVYSCIRLQNRPVQESAAHRDHLWMKYWPSSATKVKYSSWVFWDTKFCVITGLAVPSLPVLFSQPATHTSIHPSIHPPIRPTLHPSLSCTCSSFFALLTLVDLVIIL